MRPEIPAAVLAVTADVMSDIETHATLDGLFTYAGAFGDPPDGNKQAKALAWLRRTNKETTPDPLRVLGRIIEALMETPHDPFNDFDTPRIKGKDRLVKVLAECNLQYVAGGFVTSGLGAPTKALSDFIRDKDYAAIDHEFQRALQNVDAKPRDAVSAASNILESICKVIIEDEDISLPSKQDLQGLWGAVRKHLGLDPSVIQDQDLQQILSGAISIVHGIGALRTHASSAHGAGRKAYRLEPRHARLAVHSAHTISLFILETWQKKRNKV
jgi:hypothetical protein